MSATSLVNTGKDAAQDKNFEINHELSLVEGEFHAGAVQERLMRIVSDSLAYHSLQSFSSKERFGLPDTDSERKVKELNHFKNNVSELLDYAKDRGLQLRVEASVNVSLV